MKKFSTRIFIGFISIISLIAGILTISYNQFFTIVEQETIREMTSSIEYVVEEIDTIFYNNYDLALDVANIQTFDKINNGNPITMYDHAVLAPAIMNRILPYPYISELILIPRNSDYLLTANGSHLKDDFFQQLYDNDIYSYDFWENAMEEDFVTRYYPSSIYTNNSVVDKKPDRNFITVASKTRYHSNYLILIMIDTNSLISSLGEQMTDSLNVLSKDGVLLSTSAISQNKSYTYEQLTEMLGENISIMEYNNDGYLYIYKSPVSNIIYTDYISKSYLGQQVLEIYGKPIVFIILAFIVGIVSSIILSNYISRPINQLTNLFTDGNEDRLTDMELITNRVNHIKTENNRYTQELADKQNQILELEYVSSLKGKHVTDTSLYPQTSTSQYTLVYIKCNDKETSPIKILKKEIKSALEKELQITHILILENNEIMMTIQGGMEQRSQDKIHDVIGNYFSQNRNDQCFTIVISNPYVNEQLSPNIYGTLTKLSKYTQLTEHTQIITESSKTTKEGVYLYLTADERKKLYDNVFRCEEEIVIEKLVALLEKNKENHIKNFHMQVLCYRIVNLCSNIMQDVNHGVSQDFDFQEIMGQLSNLYYFDDYVIFMTTFVKKMIASLPNDSKAQNDILIEKIKKYVQKNYTNDFSLEQLSSDLSISRSYLSTYFKEKTGINLSVYINNYRIMKSLDLLKDTDITIQDISCHVGIPNTNTFIRLFKKYMGVTPGHYRKTN